MSYPSLGCCFNHSVSNGRMLIKIEISYGFASIGRAILHGTVEDCKPRIEGTNAG